MEMPRHSEVRSLAWVMQPPIHDRERIYTLSVFSPTKNCKLPLRATGNHRRLLSCGQKLVMWVAQRSHPSSLYPVPSTGSGENCPLCQALLRPRSGEDHGIKPVPASAPLGPAVPGRAARSSVLVGNSPCSFSGPFCSPYPVGWAAPGLGRAAPCSLGAWTAAFSQSPSLQTRLSILCKPLSSLLPATCP